jgi:glyoxylase-like metal-dependent hydrolase (beta-lactamase superfamily II)
MTDWKGPLLSQQLQYPFEAGPAAGDKIEVADGVYWARFAIPMKGLDHINVWLLEDGDGWTVVDTGVKTDEVRAAWEQVFETELDGRPITRVICTHFHPDHLGMAGWLTERWQAPLWMTLGEWSFGRMLSLEARADVPEDVLAFYEQWGITEQMSAELRSGGFFRYKSRVSEIPRSFRRIRHGDVISIGRHDWRVVVGNGHSPEHACLFSEELNVLISGDQVLPRISPHIGVYPSEPEANPLKDFIDSAERLRTLPKDCLVLPSHHDVFYGLHVRIDYYVDHHGQRLERLFEACDAPRTVIELLPAMFKRRLRDRELFLAMAEGLAHCNYLIAEGRLQRVVGSDGIMRFVRPGEIRKSAA